MLKSPKTKELADGLIERNSSMLEEIPVHKDEEGSNRGIRSKALNEVKLVEDINTNPRSFLKISPVQRKVLPSHKLQDHAY